MALVRPRLTDHFKINLTQDDADFAIPYLDEDIKLCVDPFLLFKSPSQQDVSLFESCINAFNRIGYLVNKGKEDEAAAMLIQASECDEVGLGFSNTRAGAPIGRASADRVLALFRDIPQVKEHGFSHFEEIQLYVDQIGKDRISDLSCTFLKSFLIDYTMDQCRRHGIPTQDAEVKHVYRPREKTIRDSEKVAVPVNPDTGRPVLLVPKRWLRKAPWINYDDYVKSYFLKEVDPNSKLDHPAILNFNRQNYDMVQVYVKQKERVAADCKNDPLFKPIAVLSATSKLAELKKLKSGNKDKADKRYEDLVVQLFASVLYPHLDFADDQSRTESGVLIRDLVFYNNTGIPFLKEIIEKYGSYQIVMEIKNVREIEREHVNQLNRYLNDNFGRFGILITRNPLSSAMRKNVIGLWSGQRRCILALTDADVELMVSLYKDRQRLPIEVIQRAYVQFTRECPS